MLHLGDHNITAGVRAHDVTANGELHKVLVKAFSEADTAQVIRAMDQIFAGKTFSLKSLFPR